MEVSPDPEDYYVPLPCTRDLMNIIFFKEFLRKNVGKLFFKQRLRKRKPKIKHFASYKTFIEYQNYDDLKTGSERREEWSDDKAKCRQLVTVMKMTFNFSKPHR